jgi:hypothetical protein
VAEMMRLLKDFQVNAL